MAEDNTINIKIKTIADIRAFDKVQKSLASLKIRPLDIGSWGKVNNELKKTQQLGVRVGKAIGSTADGFGVASTSIKVNNNELKKTQQLGRDASKTADKLNNLSGALTGISLSTLFFGMALNRLATSITKAAVTSFMKITEGSTTAGQALTALSANWELLKFTVGDAIASALEPLIPFLIDTITWIQQWVDEHQELAAAIIIGVCVLGILLLVFGTLGSALSGVIKLFAILAPYITTAKLLFMSLVAEFGLAAVLVTIGLIVAVIVVLIAFFKSNIGNVQEFIKSSLGIIWEIIKKTVDFLWNLLKDIFDLIVAIFSGDWEKVGALLIKIIKESLDFVIFLFVGLSVLIINVFMFAWNVVVDLFFNIVVKGVLGLIKLIGYALDLIGLDMGKTIMDAMDTAKVNVTNVQSAIKPSYFGVEDVKRTASSFSSSLGLTPSNTQTNTNNITINVRDAATAADKATMFSKLEQV